MLSCHFQLQTIALLHKGQKHGRQGPRHELQGQIHEQQQLRNNNLSSLPPATLPRTKPPEVPVPAARKIPAGNQTLPRTGTNPFRTETNPFRRESLPTESIDAGEYVTVAPRRGSLDDRIKLMPAQSHQNELCDLKVKSIFFVFLYLNGGGCGL